MRKFAIGGKIGGEFRPAARAPFHSPPRMQDKFVNFKFEII
jgi:hypothetical protein